MSVKSGVKGRGSDRRWERRWWLWWGDVLRMRWTRVWLDGDEERVLHDEFYHQWSRYITDRHTTS